MALLWKALVSFLLGALKAYIAEKDRQAKLKRYELEKARVDAEVIIAANAGLSRDDVFGRLRRRVELPSGPGGENSGASGSG